MSMNARGTRIDGLDDLMIRAVEACSVGVSIADAVNGDLPVIYVNRAFEAMTGYPAAQVLGRNCRFLQGPDTDAIALGGLREAIAAGADHTVVLRNYRADGSPMWVELRMSPLRDGSDCVTHYLGFQNDVTARVDAEQQVVHSATHDPLTGIPNRALILQTLQREVARAVRSATRVALLFFDLDGFKSINDQHGHAAGDLALITASERIGAALREGDLLGRHSGDEFIAVLTDVEPERALQIARRAADALLRSVPATSGPHAALSVSVGVAMFPDHAVEPDQLVIKADQAMYAAKAAGRGRAVLATGS
jgi:diguanylate cyclase (GGDEF)-like protein/PAS domain S-box-containing protein